MTESKNEDNFQENNLGGYPPNNPDNIADNCAPRTREAPRIREAKDNLLVCYLLFLGTVFGGVSAIVGLIILYANRDENCEAWTDSHFTYLINTFWIGLGTTSIAIALVVFGVFKSILFVIIGGLLGFVAAILYFTRIISGALRLYHGKEISHPETWLI